MEAEPTKVEPPKRRRRWFQFSLRTLMIVVTLLAVMCACTAWVARIARDRAATERAEKVHQARVAAEAAKDQYEREKTAYDSDRRRFRLSVVQHLEKAYLSAAARADKLARENGD